MFVNNVPVRVDSDCRRLTRKGTRRIQYAWKNRLGPEALFNGHRSCSDRLAAFGRFHLPQENRSYKFAHQDTYRRVGLPPEREAAGRKTSSSNTEPVLETAHEDAERDDEHLVGNTAKLTRLLKASTDTLSLMA